MTVIVVSECFPNKYRPVTGEFIFQHVKALSKYCKVITIVPLRFVPPRELFTFTPFKLISNVYKWFYAIKTTNNFEDVNLKVIYLKYISLPRSFFEVLDTRVIKFLFYKKFKKILKNDSIDLIYCNWIRHWAAVCAPIAVHFKIPFVIDNHEDIATLKHLFPRKYRKFLRVFGMADKIIVHSSQSLTETQHQMKINNMKSVEVEKIYYGQNFFPDKTKKQFNTKQLNLICVTHLTEPRKNIEYLIEAIALVQSSCKLNFNLKIVGDGVLKQKYETITASLSLEKQVIFLGRKSQEEIEDILDNSDVFVLPSYPEAFGIVLLEALSKGLPVITCFGNGGGEELKLLGYPTVLVKPKTSHELANAIIELCNDKGKMTELSEQGKLLIENYFTWEKNALCTYNFLKKTINDYKQVN